MQETKEMQETIEVLFGARANGKTMTIIQHAAKNNKCIFCPTEALKQHILTVATHMGVNVDVVVFHELVEYMDSLERGKIK